MRAVLTAVLMIGLIGPIPALAADITLPLGDNVSGIAIGKAETDQIVVFVSPRDVGGMLAICGAVVVQGKNASTRRYEARFTRQLPFELAGQRLRGVRTAEFIRYASMTELESQPVGGCSVTKLSWQAGYATTKVGVGRGGKIWATDQ